jgi:hypothetical protein
MPRHCSRARRRGEGVLLQRITSEFIETIVGGGGQSCPGVVCGGTEGRACDHLHRRDRLGPRTGRCTAVGGHPELERRTAHHEAGHPRLGMQQPGGRPSTEVSIVPRGRVRSTMKHIVGLFSNAARQASCALARVFGACGSLWTKMPSSVRSWSSTRCSSAELSGNLETAGHRAARRRTSGAAGLAGIRSSPTSFHPSASRRK